MNNKKKPRRCQGLGLDPCLDSSIPRFSNSLAWGTPGVNGQKIVQDYMCSGGGRDSGQEVQEGGQGGRRSEQVSEPSNLNPAENRRDSHLIKQ
jgi:hypothetical protein